MKRLLFVTLFLFGLWACSDAVVEVLQDASVPDASADGSIPDGSIPDASVCQCDVCECPVVEPEEWVGTPVECTDFGSGQYAAVFQVRPGITQVEECYSNSPGVTAGPLTTPYCWRGFAWWKPGTTEGFMFCNSQTTSVTVYY
jgi:hypothetical protein